MSRAVQVTFDAGDPGALCAFWCEVLDYRLEAPPQGFDDWDSFLDSVGVPPERRNDRSAARPVDGDGPRLFFQKVPEGKSAKNRVHLDVRSAPGQQGEERMATLQAEADRLVGLGATQLRRVEPAPPMEAGFIVMQDPEDNEFCLD
jgi:hypothetical protein